MSQTVVFDDVLDGSRARDARLRVMWQMTVAQRIAAMRSGKLSLEQCAAWAARHPEQVPTVNGEFEYIARCTTEILD
jgi:hypothetical protein